MSGPLRVDNSPFTQEQVDLLGRLLPTLAPQQAIWLSGYLAASEGSGPFLGQPSSSSGQRSAETMDLTPSRGTSPRSIASPSVDEVTILHGSQTGNASRLASQLHKRLVSQGIAAQVGCMSDYKPSNLKKAKTLLVVVSTHGEGEPPDKAQPLQEFLLGRRAPKLEGCRFSVLALGDLTYTKFCQTGRDLDRRLEELGAQRFFRRVECDVDYREPAEEWMAGVVDALVSHPAKGHPAKGTVPSSSELENRDSPQVAGHVCNATCSSHQGPALLAVGASEPAVASAFDRFNPFTAEVVESINLNGRGSEKETRYVKLSLEGSSFAFEPGDSLGILPENDPSLVDQLMATMGWRPDEPVPVSKQDIALREALVRHYEITQLTRPLLEQMAALSTDGLGEMVARGSGEELRDYAYGRDLVDLARDFRLTGAPAREFVRRLRPLPPRLYSISSSYRTNPDEVDVTVAALRYRSADRDREGVCSSFCCQRLEPGDRVKVYIHSNPNFRMPADPQTPIIMIGPGTGVAPFRAFLEEREELGVEGRSWLFFGDRRFRTDFLYQTDWLRWRKAGVLSRIDVAFSRDGDRKVYVQHRMRERAADLYAWLQEGAYVYVCGNEKAMARDVHAALESIVQQEGGMTAEASRAYVADLQRANRYQRDVY